MSFTDQMNSLSNCHFHIRDIFASVIVFFLLQLQRLIVNIIHLSPAKLDYCNSLKNINIPGNTKHHSFLDIQHDCIIASNEASSYHNATVQATVGYKQNIWKTIALIWRKKVRITCFTVFSGESRFAGARVHVYRPHSISHHWGMEYWNIRWLIL